MALHAKAKLLLKAVRKYTDCRWVLLYIERWLKAPAQLEDGSIVPRTAGTPQGGVVSPCLANLFLHYVFDKWMGRSFPDIRFERYADDIICHFRSAEEAQVLWSALEARVVACRLALHPQKTMLVYCKDANRRGDHPIQSFDFLGYEWPRSAVWHGRQLGVSFLPAASPKALKAIPQTVRRWVLDRRSDKALEDLARMFNPHIQGWINYYGHFYRSRLLRDLQRIDAYLVRWSRYKYTRLRAQTSGHDTGWFGSSAPIQRSLLISDHFLGLAHIAQLEGWMM
jgi:group II intron reverse transcriptase/maturase